MAKVGQKAKKRVLDNSEISNLVTGPGTHSKGERRGLAGSKGS